MKTYIYIDGLNLYYRAVRGTPYKWLDIATLFQKMYPHNNICKIKYFTSIVKSRPDDLGKPGRQQMFLRALRTFPHIEIIEGKFQMNKARMRLVSPDPNGPNTAEVWKTEEKGSDVNIAVHLLNDAHSKNFDVAVFVSNDSDFAEAIRIVTQDLNLQVSVVSPTGAINPNTGDREPARTSRTLQQYASSVRRIRSGILASSQLPNTLTDAKGAFHKPPEW